MKKRMLPALALGLVLCACNAAPTSALYAAPETPMLYTPAAETAPAALPGEAAEDLVQLHMQAQDGSYLYGTAEAQDGVLVRRLSPVDGEWTVLCGDTACAHAGPGCEGYIEWDGDVVLQVSQQRLVAFCRGYSVWDETSGDEEAGTIDLLYSVPGQVMVSSLAGGGFTKLCDLPEGEMDPDIIAAGGSELYHMQWRKDATDAHAKDLVALDTVTGTYRTVAQLPVTEYISGVCGGYLLKHTYSSVRVNEESYTYELALMDTEGSTAVPFITWTDTTPFQYGSMDGELYIMDGPAILHLDPVSGTRTHLATVPDESLPTGFRGVYGDFLLYNQYDGEGKTEYYAVNLQTGDMPLVSPESPAAKYSAWGMVGDMVYVQTFDLLTETRSHGFVHWQELCSENAQLTMK